MPQPNMQQMLRQVQKMQADMARAQEELAAAEVEASAGGGMVNVRVSGSLVVKEIRIDPAAIDPDDPELLADMVLGAVNEGLRAAQELAAQKIGRRDRRPRPRRARRPGDPGPLNTFAPPIARLVTELSKLPGIGNRTAQRLAFHILRATRRRSGRAGGGDPRGQGADRPVRGLLQPRRGPRCRICQDAAARPGLICVVEEPGDVIPIERTHEYRGRLPRARRRAVADRRRRPRGPEDRRAVSRACRPRATPVREVVLATNPTTTGEATALHIAGGLRERAPEVTRDAAGERPAGRRGPRVRRRGDARARLRGPPRRLAGRGRRRANAEPRILPTGDARASTIVMKFGGTSVADAERIKRAARADRRQARGAATAWSRCSRRAARRPTS